MNIHAPDAAIREQFRCLEWLGKRYQRKGEDGVVRTYIRARHKATGQKVYYCFEENWGWLA